MGVYESNLFWGLKGVDGIEVYRHRWPVFRNRCKNRYLSVLDTYRKRHLVYPSKFIPISADIYHVLDHSYAHLINHLPPKRTIITCHDLMPLMLSEYKGTLGGRLSLISFRYSVEFIKYAQHIIADSLATKEAIMDIMKLPGNRISVVPLGVDEIFLRPEDSRGGKENDSVQYILQVGATSEPYKNTMNILRAFSHLLKWSKGRIKLLKVGKTYTSEQWTYIKEQGLLNNVEYLGIVERNDLPEVYRRSSVLLMPSLYEGFGLPILEAMACGIPVVTSARGSIPELVGDDVMLVNPEDPQNIADGVKTILSDPLIREKLIGKGKDRVKAFTWRKTANITSTIYKNIIQNG